MNEGLIQSLEEALRDKIAVMDSLTSVIGDRKKVYEEWNGVYNEIYGQPFNENFNLQGYNTFIPNAVMKRIDSIEHANKSLMNRYGLRRNNGFVEIEPRELVNLEILKAYANVLKRVGTLNDPRLEEDFIHSVDWLADRVKDERANQKFLKEEHKRVEGLYKKLNPAYSGGNQNE